MTASVLPETSAKQAERRSSRRPPTQLLKQAVLLATALLSLFPILLIASTAVRDPVEVRVDPFGLLTSFSL